MGSTGLHFDFRLSIVFWLDNYDGRRSPRINTIYEFERRDESSCIVVSLEFYAPTCRAFTVEIDVYNPAEAFQPFERIKIAIDHVAVPLQMINIPLPPDTSPPEIISDIPIELAVL
jgi:hypothetical protein